MLPAQEIHPRHRSLAAVPARVPTLHQGRAYEDQASHSRRVRLELGSVSVDTARCAPDEAVRSQEPDECERIQCSPVNDLQGMSQRPGSLIVTFNDVIFRKIVIGSNIHIEVNTF